MSPQQVGQIEDESIASLEKSADLKWAIERSF
jgi:hypothetical protein